MDLVLVRRVDAWAPSHSRATGMRGARESAVEPALMWIAFPRRRYLHAVRRRAPEKENWRLTLVNRQATTQFCRTLNDQSPSAVR